MWRPGVCLCWCLCDTGEDMAKASDLIHLLIPGLSVASQCGVAYGAVWLGCDENAAIDRTFSVEIKARFVSEEGE